MYVQGNSSNLRRCCEIEKKNGEWFVGRRPVSHPGCLGSTPRGSGGMGQHLQRIAAWFRGRTPLSEARGLGSTPRGSAGLGRLLRRIAAWFRGRTPLSEARGLGSTPRGSGGLGRLLLGPWSVPWRIAAWFGVRTPLSEARGLGSIPRGAGLCRGKSPHGSEAGHCRGESAHGLEAGHRFQKHEAWVRFPVVLVCAVENRRTVRRPDTAFRSTRPGFDSPRLRWCGTATTTAHCVSCMSAR